ncbi:glycerophosphodiester phosphodiesterase family protein [Acinetobacter sp. c3-l95]|uniref:glycerophosphodiester phosphodiesterase family protein n=1 Tax=Acinetobacter sp. c3-l95 TaxID=3342804 RepID=UPI0035BA805B
MSIVCGSLALTACNSTDIALMNKSSSFSTLDKKTPIVISHRGYSGVYPEQTLIAYAAAADVGSSYLETDMHMTKDCQIALRHNAWLSDNTNIAEVAKTNSEVAARQRTVPGMLVNVPNWRSDADGPAQYLTDLTDPNDPKSVLKSLVVDGEEHVNDWSISDFTMDELRQWVRGTTYDNKADRPTNENGRWPVMSLQELINVAKSKGRQYNRTIYIYPEVKNPYWNNAQAVANGCAGTRPFEDALLKVLKDNNLNNTDSPVIVQSFDPENLKYLRAQGLKTKAVQLIDGVDIDYKTGKMSYNDGGIYTIVDGRPYSWTVKGDLRYFDSMLTPAGLAEIKKYADGIGPWKPQIAYHVVSPWKASNPDGTPYTGKLADVTRVTPTSLIEDAHKAGLFVHGYTFRNENSRLAGLYKGDPVAEYLVYYRAGIDGVFTDFTPTALKALKQYKASKEEAMQIYDR